jgi:ketosteroid isomerase-like protein
MRSIAPVIVLVTALVVPAFAQKAEIEAVNAKWIEFFNKGDFAGVASLYAEDATAFPPGSSMVKGRAAIETRPQSNRKSFSATPALMGSGSLELAFASSVPSIMSEKATRTNDTATFACLSMTIPPGKILKSFLVRRPSAGSRS